MTLKLWGGPSDQGCCSVADVDDARRVADRLGIDHHVFNFADDFEARVVAPYVAAHDAGRTPNPCIECNRHLKFDRLPAAGGALGFDAVATGHHARVVVGPDGRRRLARGADCGQGPVLRPLHARPGGPGPGAAAGGRADQGGGPSPRPPGGACARRPSPTARTSASSPPAAAGRRSSAAASPCGPAGSSTRAGRCVGRSRRVQLVTIGQRRGLGTPGGPAPRYVVDVDVERPR